jgi:hypothetical protein
MTEPKNPVVTREEVERFAAKHGWVVNDSGDEQIVVIPAGSSPKTVKPVEPGDESDRPRLLD